MTVSLVWQSQCTTLYFEIPTPVCALARNDNKAELNDITLGKGGFFVCLKSAIPFPLLGNNTIKFVSLRISDRVTGVAISVYNAIL